MQTALNIGREILTDSISTILILFKILVPALIIVKVLDHYGATEFLGTLTQPLMSPLGLPDMAGLIWATTMVVNIYAGVTVFLTLASPTEWSEAQVTCLALLMLTTHNLVVELRIAQQSGCRLLTQLVFRLLTAVLFCYVCQTVLTHGELLQEPATFLWQQPQTDLSLIGWVIEQLFTLIKIAIIIVLLISLLRLLKALGIERLLKLLLTPLFQFMGLGREAMTLTIVGFTLGLAYGGGLLIKEAKSGKVNQEDVFTSMTLLGVCHSLIEDTLLVMIIGANVYTVLFARLVMSILLISLVVILVKRVNEKTWHRYFFRPSKTN